MGAHPHIRVYAKLFGEYGTIDEITSALRISPTCSEILPGTKIDPTFDEKRKFIYWERSLEEECIDPTRLLWDLLREFDPENTRKLKDALALRMEFTIVVTTTGTMPSLCFPSKILRRLAKLDAVLDIDIILTSEVPDG